MTLKLQSSNVTTTVTTRRPTLLRVWRTNGAELTSTWLPTLAPKIDLSSERGPRL